MKRFWFIIVAAGLVTGMNAESAPFYKVQCYDANDKLVDCGCDAVAKTVKKHTKKKIVKAATPKTDTLAEQKARELAIALREKEEQAKQNEELKEEMQALRQANLLAAAKAEEKPATISQLAPQTVVAVPAPAPTPTATTQIAKDIETKEETQYGGAITNEVGQSFKPATPFANEVDMWFDYTPTKHITLEFEQDIYWNWNIVAGANNPTDHAFSFEDFSITFIYSDIYHTESKQTQLDGSIQALLPTTQAARDAGKILTPVFKLTLINKINDSKGALNFEAKVTPVINKYTTSAPTGVAYSDTTKEKFYDATDNNQTWERVDPNDRLKFGFKTILKHKIVDKLGFEASVAINSAYTYADEVSVGGKTYTLKEAIWKNTLELTAPKISYAFSDAVSIQAKLVTTTNFNEFKLYNTDTNYSGSNTSVYFKLLYCI